MKHGIKFTVMAALLSLTASQGRADQTNLLRNLDIHLSGVEQGGSSTTKNVTTTTVNKVKIETEDVIAAIGAATGNNFSANAQLMVVTTLPYGPTSTVIRDGGNSVDVGAFLWEGYLSGIVGKSTVNNKTGKSSGSNYSVQEFLLQDNEGYQLGLHYDVTGVATENFSIPAIPGPRSELSADVSGSGDIGGNLIILQGTIRVHGQAFEVVPGDGGGPTT